MTAMVHSLPGLPWPEHLIPAFHPPVGGPIRFDFRNFETMMADLRTASDFARAQQLAILQMAFDRNGAYLVIAPSPRLYKIFGNECAWVQRKVEHGLRIEHWLGCIGHIRVFWREVKCMH